MVESVTQAAQLAPAAQREDQSDLDHLFLIEDEHYTARLQLAPHLLEARSNGLRLNIRVHNISQSGQPSANLLWSAYSEVILDSEEPGM